jgi:hypothetical protein
MKRELLSEPKSSILWKAIALLLPIGLVVIASNLPDPTEVLWRRWVILGGFSLVFPVACVLLVLWFWRLHQEGPVLLDLGRLYLSLPWYRIGLVWGSGIIFVAAIVLATNTAKIHLPQNGAELLTLGAVLGMLAGASLPIFVALVKVRVTSKSVFGFTDRVSWDQVTQYSWEAQGPRENKWMLYLLTRLPSPGRQPARLVQVQLFVPLPRHAQMDELLQRYAPGKQRVPDSQQKAVTAP